MPHSHRSITSIIRNKNVLDVNCGNGISTKRMIEAARPASIVALEAGPDYEEAHRRLSPHGVSVHKLDITSAVAERRHREAYDVVTVLGWCPVKRRVRSFVESLADAVDRNGTVVITMKWDEREESREIYYQDCEYDYEDDYGYDYEDDHDTMDNSHHDYGSRRSPLLSTATVPSKSLRDALYDNFLSVDISTSDEVSEDGYQLTKMRIICERPTDQTYEESMTDQPEWFWDDHFDGFDEREEMLEADFRASMRAAFRDAEGLRRYYYV